MATIPFLPITLLNQNNIWGSPLWHLGYEAFVVSMMNPDRLKI